MFELGKGAAYVQHGREFDHDVWCNAEQIILQGYGIRLAVADGYQFAAGITAAGRIQVYKVQTVSGQAGNIILCCTVIYLNLRPSQSLEVCTGAVAEFGRHLIVVNLGGRTGNKETIYTHSTGDIGHLESGAKTVLYE